MRPLAAAVLVLPLSAVAAQPAPVKPLARYEVGFMIDMIDHHAMAVEMAEICLEEAFHTDLREMCEDIAAAQTAEIEEMQAWLSDWYDVSYAPDMKRGDERVLDRLASTDGAEFEVMFMEMMIRHHRRAIREGEQCVDRAWHDPLEAMCEDIVATQTAEIETLETWLCGWYDRC
jgi:uncharacterized protein (DUF305 family)